MSTRQLAEPAVLATTKRRPLGSDEGGPGRYVVTDTQFTVDEWLNNQPVSTALREALTPFKFAQTVGVSASDLSHSV